MSTRRPFSSVIGSTIQRYLALKEALGRLYSVERRVLKHLDTFLAGQRSGRADLTARTFASWCRTYLHLASGVRRNWMRIARNLCLYRRRLEPSCFVPDLSQFPKSHQPSPPYIFTKHEIARVLRATDRLEPTSSSPLRRQVFRLAVVLLYTAGLRRRELLRLKLGDYDVADGTLLVRASKFYKSRVIALSPDAARELDAYLVVRRRRRATTGDAPLLANWWESTPNTGRAYSGHGLRQGVRALLEQADIRTPTGAAPRVEPNRRRAPTGPTSRWRATGRPA